MFWLAFKTGLLTILTLGFYRFWMKTRLRRWYWSATRPAGIPLEYTGQPLEKLLGFLIVVVFLAFYLGLANLILTFVSLAVFAEYTFAYVISAIVIAPLWFFAQYRSRRYVLARTRWRSIRFGLEPGAWGYARRALLGWIGVVLSLGMSHPALRFQLEKYRNDRTFYGNHRLQQGGHKTMLYPAFVHLALGVFFTVGSFLAAMEEGQEGIAMMMVVSVPWALFGLVHYIVEGRRIMASHLTTGAMTLVPKPRVLKVLHIYVVGNLFRFSAALLILMITGFLFLAAAAAILGGFEFLFQMDPDEMAEDVFLTMPAWITGALGLASYFLLFLVWSALTHAFITFPIWRHYAETLQIDGLAELGEISQRGRDEFAEAEGFAEALDVGAAI